MVIISINADQNANKKPIKVGLPTRHSIHFLPSLFTEPPFLNFLRLLLGLRGRGTLLCALFISRVVIQSIGVAYYSTQRELRSIAIYTLGVAITYFVRTHGNAS